MTRKPSPSRRPDPDPPPADLWSVWFSRLVQIGGFSLVIYEATVEKNDRPYLLLVALAMMLGALGLKMVVEWLTKRNG